MLTHFGAQARSKAHCAFAVLQSFASHFGYAQCPAKGFSLQSLTRSIFQYASRIVRFSAPAIVVPARAPVRTGTGGGKAKNTELTIILFYRCSDLFDSRHPRLNGCSFGQACSGVLSSGGSNPIAIGCRSSTPDRALSFSTALEMIKSVLLSLRAQAACSFARCIGK